MNRIDNKTAVVTGGGSGIGAATCEMFAKAGARVVVSDINIETARLVSASINRQGGTSIALDHDVTNESDWDRVFKKTTEEYGQLDVLVNNAGVSGAGLPPIEEATLQSWRQVMDVNLDSVFLGSQKAIMLMKDHGGSIINISSIYGIVGGAGAAYNASKGGVRLLSKSLAVHCGNAGYNIRVNSVHPGFIWTPLVKNIVNFMTEDNMTEAGFKEMLTERHPIGRLGVAEDVAKSILFLASEDASFITGSELVVDGGYTAV